MKYYIILILLISAVLAACAGSIPEPTQADAEIAAVRWPGTNLEFLHHGRKLYISKCSGCHSLYKPQLYTGSEWDTILVKMSKKAKLNSGQFEDLQRFLTVMGKEAETAAKN